MKEYFTAQKIFHRHQLHTECVLAVEEGSVLGILPRTAAPSSMVLHDFGERILAPGWVDLQVNGCGGGLFNRDGNLLCLEKMLCSNLRHGATSIQPTLITCSDEDILSSLEVVRQAKAAKEPLWQGILGMHLEGPYISVPRRGAHPGHLVRSLDEAVLSKLEAAGRDGVLSYITVGAESVSPQQVARLSRAGVTVSIGHSAAPIAASRALLTAGARCFTHLYNGMGDIQGRDPRTLSLALEAPQVHSSLIADGHHVAAENMRIAQRLLGDRLFLVTDATATEDGGEETVLFGEQTCWVQDGIIRNQEGVLAGSALTMQRGVEVLAGLFGLEVALDMASAGPVRALNPLRPQNIGSFQPGTKANFVILDYAPSGQISNLETWILGQKWSE